MKLGTFASAAAVVALGLAAYSTIKAQGPLYDRVDVNLPYTVTIGDRTLQPGNYVIQQLRSTAGDSKVLLIYSDNGMRFETSAMTIPALDPNTARDTKVILHHFGNDYYFDKVWIQGKDYGYEFPLPDSVKGREREQSQAVSVAANYSSVPATNAETTTAKQTTEASATNNLGTSAATNQSTSPAATQPMTQSAANQPITNPPATNQQATSMAQNSPSPTTNQSTVQPQSTMAQNTMPQSTMPRSTADNGANREMQDTTSNPSSMPHTSAGWLMMLLSGGALSGAGMTLRRKR